MRQEFGKIVDGELVIISPREPGAKVVVYLEVPAFDQEAQAVVHSHYAETLDKISVHNKVIDLPLDEGDGEEGDFEG